MRTYTHFLQTAALRQATNLSDEEASSGLLAGAVAPDIPLALLSLGFIIDRRFVRRHLPDKTRCSPSYNDLFFHNPWWIAAHNSLHAPLPLAGLVLLGFSLQNRRLGRWVTWFAAGCGLHTAVDIFTHADDGPVLLFPLNWHTRFQGPVSYWDPRHGGRVFRLVEHLLDLLLILFLAARQSGPAREPRFV